eukprot:5910224-Pleurochrysis_carterae.AAC.2
MHAVSKTYTDDITRRKRACTAGTYGMSASAPKQNKTKLKPDGTSDTFLTNSRSKVLRSVPPCCCRWRRQHHRLSPVALATPANVSNGRREESSYGVHLAPTVPVNFVATVNTNRPGSSNKGEVEFVACWEKREGSTDSSFVMKVNFHGNEKTVERGGKREETD